MNQRIKELAMLADIRSMLILERLKTVDALTDAEQNELLSFEKFAELIIMECASIVYRTCQDGDAGAQAILYEFDIDDARNQK